MELSFREGRLYEEVHKIKNRRANALKREYQSVNNHDLKPLNLRGKKYKNDLEVHGKKHGKLKLLKSRAPPCHSINAFPLVDRKLTGNNMQMLFPR